MAGRSIDQSAAPVFLPELQAADSMAAKSAID